MEFSRFRAFLWILTMGTQLMCSVSQRTWLSELFLEARSTFTMHANVTETCKKDFESYSTHAQNHTVWAIRMKESSEWPVVGLFAGMNKHLGNWAECVRAEGPGFRGQYCLVRLQIDLPDDHHSAVRDGVMTAAEMETSSAWRVIRSFEGNLIRASRLDYRWALCVPSSCQPPDVEMSLNASMRPIFNEAELNTRISVEPEFCQTSQRPHYSDAFRYTCVFFGAIIVCVGAATGFHLLWRNSDDPAIKIFSAISNYKKLTNVTRDTNVNYLFYWTRIVAMSFIISTHVVLIGVQLATFQTEQIEEDFSPYQFATDFMVDLFFVMSGYLMFDNNFEAVVDAGLPYIVVKVIFRHVKMMSTYILYVLFTVNVSPYLSDGPFWKAEILKETDICKNYWWLNVLGIVNLVSINRLCLLITWFSTVLAQLTVIGGVLIFVVSVNRKYGIFSLAFAVVFSVLVTFFTVYLRQYNAIYKILLRGFDNLRSVEDSALYMATYPRIGPYVIGFAAAVLTDGLRKRGYKFTTTWTLTTSTLLVGIALKVTSYRVLLAMPGRPYDALENATYAAVQRCLLILPFVFLSCVYFTNRPSWAASVIEKKNVAVVGKLVEHVYHVHGPILIYQFFSLRTFSSIYGIVDASVLWSSISCTVLSFIYAFFIHILIDGPVKNIIDVVEKQAQKKFTKSKKKRT